MSRARELSELATAYDSGGGFGNRNRIINGDMRIDQRNAGASVAFNSSSNFGVDRFKTYNTVGSGSTVQRSTTAPAGFSNSLLFTVGTGASPSASSECIFFQPIEGFNVSDLGFGTASASSVTVSFQVRSSVTGTYAFRLRNQAGNRSYVATYTVNAANTWETKSVTIAGDTSGTWATDNTIGILLTFDLGSGSDYNTTASAWQAGNYTRTSGCVNFIATSGATFYITGVQLEAGSVASPFERRDYGRELQMCQRYCYNFSSAVASGAYTRFSYGDAVNTVTFQGNVVFPVTMRTTPSLTAPSSSSFALYSRAAIFTCTSGPSIGDGTTPYASSFSLVVASGLTQGSAAAAMANNNNTAFLLFTAEL